MKDFTMIAKTDSTTTNRNNHNNLTDFTMTDSTTTDFTTIMLRSKKTDSTMITDFTTVEPNLMDARKKLEENPNPEKAENSDDKLGSLLL